jgi:hypothetical protein
MITVHKSVSQNYSIVAPTGGLGNHVRWLALLSPEIAFTIKEINNGYENITPFTTLGQKLKFFEGRIYGPSRSWHNWLDIEWTFRPALQQVISFSHEYDPNFDKVLALISDFDLCLHHYVKFNCSLNMKNSFRDSWHRKHKENYDLAIQYPNNTKIMSTAPLVAPFLDRDFYTELVEWFGITDMYDAANKVHGWWFAADRRAEKDFVKDITEFYK